MKSRVKIKFKDKYDRIKKTNGDMTFKLFIPNTEYYFKVYITIDNKKILKDFKRITGLYRCPTEINTPIIEKLITIKKDNTIGYMFFNRYLFEKEDVAENIMVAALHAERMFFKNKNASFEASKKYKELRLIENIHEMIRSFYIDYEYLKTR